MKTFETNFRGYDKDQVDKYILELEHMYDSTLREQKERIFNLVDQVSSLNEQLKQYKMDEQAISKSLVESQKLASEMKYDADKYSQLTLSRAKVFYATWQTYAKTLLATLTDSEIRQFNALSDKIGNLINAYQGNADAQDIASAVIPEDIVKDTLSNMPSTACQDANPISRVQKMASNTIDPRELLSSDVPLEQLCRELGLID